MANVYFTRELAKRLKADDVKNVKTCSLHPGGVRTELSRNLMGDKPILYNLLYLLVYPLYMLMFKSPWWGTQTSLHCCLMPFDQIDSGKYYADCKVKQETFLSKNWESEANQLWDVTEKTLAKYL